jgi:predicted PurR-regulated permease PerM
MERQNVRKQLIITFGDEMAQKVIMLVREIEKKLGSWLVAQLNLMLLIGVLVYVSLLLLQVEFALPLAIIAGLMEILPIIGPWFSGALGVLVALNVSPVFGLIVAGVYFLIQQLENSVVVPVIMKRSTGLAPLVTILSLMIGARIAGLLGAVLAVPTVLILQTLLGYYLTNHTKRSVHEKIS